MSSSSSFVSSSNPSSSSSSSPSSSSPSSSFGGFTLSSSQRAALLEAEQALLPYIAAAEAQAVHDMKLHTMFRTIPSKHAAFTAFFVMMALTAVSLIVPFFTHVWVLLLVPLTTFLLMVGYLFRLHVIYDPQRSHYKAMQFFLVVSPLILAAALFSVLGFVAEVTWIPVLFVIADVVCLIVQTIGVIWAMSSDRDKISRGLDLLIAGMAITLLATVMFLIAVLSYSGLLYAKFAPILVTLLVLATILFLVRHVYRFQEFVYERVHIKDKDINQNREKNEKLFYGLDFVPAVFIVFILIFIQFLV